MGSACFSADGYGQLRWWMREIIPDVFIHLIDVEQVGAGHEPIVLGTLVSA